MPTNEPILHVDMTPDADLPLRVLRAYRANCDVKFYSNATETVTWMVNAHQRQRAKLFSAAITTLERAAKFRQAAKKSTKARGRPVKLAKRLPELKQLLRQGLNGNQIHIKMGKRTGAPSLQWIYQQIAKLKNKNP